MFMFLPELANLRLAPSSPRNNAYMSMFCSETAHVHVDHKLPFELRVLEAALSAALHAMEEDARNLTELIQPILEGLTSGVGPQSSMTMA